MSEHQKIYLLEEKIKELEKTLIAKEKICQVLTNRVVRSVDSVGGAYSIFERNILLQNLIDQRSRELEESNKKLVQEISERKQAEKKLRKNRKQLADIIEFLPDATLVIDKDGKVIAWNRAIESMTGVKKEDMIGKGNHEYALPFYGERRNILVDLVLHPETVYSGKYRYRRQKGT